MENEEQTPSDNPSQGASKETITPGTPLPTAPAKEEAAPGQGAARDWQKEYTELEKKLGDTTRNYGELRKKLQEQGSERNQYKTQLDSLNAQQKAILEAITKATAKPHDPEQFLEDFKNKGPDFIRQMLKEERESIQKQFEETRAKDFERVRRLEFDNVLKAARVDAKNFPDFTALEKDIQEIWETETLPFDPTKMEPEELVEALYKLAKLRHRDDALKAAADFGKKTAEERLAEEAKAAVPSGGKNNSPSIPNLSSLSLDDMRKSLVAKYGESEA